MKAEALPAGGPAPGGSVSDLLRHFDQDAEGNQAYRLIERLFPICRSITGDGIRESLHCIQDAIPLDVCEVPTGTPVFDWIVPKEWNIRNAWIKNRRGEKIVDFANSSLHVVSYSVPVHRRMGFAELRTHLFSLPEKPDWVPYRTSYYRETWGFCVTHRLLSTLAEDEDYEVYIDSSLDSGHLTYGECLLSGQTEDEVLISSHACHPALCNDNLSGISVAALLARLLKGARTRYSYRFLWLPGTIGAITWLATHEPNLPRVKHGLVLSCVGDTGSFTYKKSRRGEAFIDRVVPHVLQHSGIPFQTREFTPFGYDERQYCSPGIDLPVGCFMRTPNGQYPEYHTSADDLSLVSPGALGQSLHLLLQVIEALECNCRYVNLCPKCEPQLGRRGLYRQVGGTSNSRQEEALLWALSFSDGRHDLIEIAERSQMPISDLREAAELLVQQGLLRRAEETG